MERRFETISSRSNIYRNGCSLQAADMPKCLRSVDTAVLATALASAQQAGLADVADYMLETMSKRMAGNLRDDITELGKIKERDGEAAMTEVMIEIRRLIDEGEMEIMIPSREEETQQKQDEKTKEAPEQDTDSQDT